jgi:Flp pilus assembly protein TadD
MSIFDKLFNRKTTEATGPAAPANPPAPASSAAAKSPPAPARPSAPAQSPYDVLFAKGIAAAATHDFERAIELYDRAIEADPSRAETYYKRANALKDLDRLDEALASYNEAIERKPDYAYAFCNRGFVQHRLGLLDEASHSYDRALELEPTDAFAHYNRALLLQDYSRWPEAVAAYDQAIACNPEFSDAYLNRALASLYQGDFEKGWRDFEWRWKNAVRLAIGEARSFQQPLWLGEQPLAGKRLLLHSEGGLGDTIQFSRYAALCAARGATVLLEIQKPLLGLLGTLEGVSKLLVKDSPLPAFDYHCPLMSLPLAFKTTPDTIPAPAGYLRADPAKVAQWRTVLGERRRPRIGLVWSGNPNNPLDPHRTIRLADWVAHLPPEFQYFRLQRDVREEDEATLESSSHIFSVEDELLDFTNTAALCECMDVVLSVDTSIAHLSGALGHKTWVLVPYTPDWRWLRDRDTSPWYPSVKLYRQKTAGDWQELFVRLAADLRRELPAG